MKEETDGWTWGAEEASPETTVQWTVWVEEGTTDGKTSIGSN